MGMAVANQDEDMWITPAYRRAGPPERCSRAGM